MRDECVGIGKKVIPTSRAKIDYYVNAKQRLQRDAA
jgi:hypothetical protein